MLSESHQRRTVRSTTMAPKKAKRKPKRKGKKPIPKGQTGNGGGCPLNMVARAMERREKAYADGELLADGKATKDRDECCSYISTLLTCGLQACPAHNKAPHYHSFDVGEESKCPGLCGPISMVESV